MTNIVTLNKISPEGLSKLTDDYTIVEDINDAEGIILRSADLHHTEFPKGMLGIARAGAGVNNIPLEDCAKAGIVVFNTPGANANAVKELVLAAMLVSARNLVHAARWERVLTRAVTAANGPDEDIAAHKAANLGVDMTFVPNEDNQPDVLKTVEKNKGQFAGTEIAGKKLGVIGMGAIGVLVANAAEDLEMEVVGYDPYLPETSAEIMHDTITMVDDLTDMVKDCDYVTIHVPVNDGTKGMVSKEVIDAMKPNCVFLNFARNTLVDEEALLDALTNDKLGGYITDFGTEALLTCDKVIPFPHLGASTKEAEDNCAVMATRQLMDYIEHGNIVNSVNYPACNLGKVAADAKCRIAVMGEDVPDMVRRVSNCLEGIAIVDMASRVRGAFGYCLLDLERMPEETQLAAISAIPGVLRVRLLDA